MQPKGEQLQLPLETSPKIGYPWEGRQQVESGPLVRHPSGARILVRLKLKWNGNEVCGATVHWSSPTRKVWTTITVHGAGTSDWLSDWALLWLTSRERQHCLRVLESAKSEQARRTEAGPPAKTIPQATAKA